MADNSRESGALCNPVFGQCNYYFGRWYLCIPCAMSGSYLLLTFVSLLYILLSLSLGIFISTVAPNQMVAMFISLFALMLPTILLSGFIYPIENMPVWLQWFSYIMPPRYYISALKDVMFKGAGLLVVWKEVLVMTGFLVAFLLLSIRNFKVRLE